jgi:hypothetical protein
MVLRLFVRVISNVVEYETGCVMSYCVNFYHPTESFLIHIDFGNIQGSGVASIKFLFQLVR